MYNTPRPTYNQPWDTRQASMDHSIILESNTSIFLYNINSKETIIFNIIPESIGDSYSPNINTQSSILGRSTPIYFYSGSGEKTLSFTFSIHEDLLPKNSKMISRNMKDFLDLLKNFSNPNFETNKNTGKKTITGPRLFMQIGKHFSGEGFIETSWVYKTPVRNQRFIVADITLNFTYDIEYRQPIITPIATTGTSNSDLSIEFKEFTDQIPNVGNGLENTDNLINLIPKYTDYTYLQTFVYEDSKLGRVNMYTREDVIKAANFLYTINKYDKDNLPIMPYVVSEHIHPAIALINTYYVDLIIINSPDAVNLYNSNNEINFNNAQTRLSALIELEEQVSWFMNYLKKVDKNLALSHMYLASLQYPLAFVMLTDEEFQKIFSLTKKLLEIIYVQKVAYSTVLSYDK